MKTLQRLFAANIPCLGFILLTGWFAYLENGYWGWPFAMACLCGKSIESAKEKQEREREEAIKRAEDIKQYGHIYKNN